ncbi:unnamed protein product [Bursaphelenchus okinawaensis]|uniref:Uncharacterized protein n=1 Tax=Bursaphelenchus okinawaensis TaxID=465554 RepID=A0A811KE50_9BILA|nr:unnamed protein product [Bursaphelenchus okinawaensis]CAG9101529.1 unnamed protein product [Bursaphelenchus okinawaensis]
MHLTSTVYKADYCDIKNYCNQPLSSFHTTYCNDNNKNTPSFEYNPQFDDYLEQSDYIDQTQPADWSDLDWTADYELDRCSQPGSQGHKIGHCEHTSYTQARCSWGYERRGSLYSQNSQESTSWSPINNIADSQRRQSPYLVSYRQYKQRAAAPRRAPFQRQPAVEMEELKTPSPENAYE